MKFHEYKRGSASRPTQSQPRAHNATISLKPHQRTLHAVLEAFHYPSTIGLLCVLCVPRLDAGRRQAQRALALNVVVAMTARSSPNLASRHRRLIGYGSLGAQGTDPGPSRRNTKNVLYIILHGQQSSSSLRVSANYTAGEVADTAGVASTVVIPNNVFHKVGVVVVGFVRETTDWSVNLIMSLCTPSETSFGGLQMLL